jgi:hypothetical protein
MKLFTLRETFVTKWYVITAPNILKNGRIPLMTPEAMLGDSGMEYMSIMVYMLSVAKQLLWYPK